MESVRSNVYSLEYASDELKGNFEIVLEAVKWLIKIIYKNKKGNFF